MNRLPLQADDDLKEIYLFSALNENQLTLIRQSTKRILIGDEERLFEMGQAASYFYLLTSGQITLKRFSPLGDEKIIEIVQPGQTFAEAVMFMGKQTYPVNAISVGRSELLAFSMKDFTMVLRESTESCFRLMADMSMRLRHWVNEIERLTMQNATCRITSFLLYNLPDLESESAIIAFPAAKNIIASRLSIKPETFSRILHDLTDKGLIDVDGRTVHVHDVRELRKVGHAWDEN